MSKKEKGVDGFLERLKNNIPLPMTVNEWIELLRGSCGGLAEEKIIANLKNIPLVLLIDFYKNAVRIDPEAVQVNRTCLVITKVLLSLGEEVEELSIEDIYIIIANVPGFVFVLEGRSSKVKWSISGSYEKQSNFLSINFENSE